MCGNDAVPGRSRRLLPGTILSAGREQVPYQLCQNICEFRSNDRLSIQFIPSLDA